MDPWPHNIPTPSISTDREKSLLQTGSFVRVPAVLPLPGLGRMQFLSSLLFKAPPTAFDNNAMAVVLRILWKNHIQKYFILDFIIYMLFYILWIVLVDISLSVDSDIRTGTFKMAIAILTFLLNVLFATKEMIQSDFGRQPQYLNSKWNIVDLLSMGCVWCYIIATCFLGSLSSGWQPLAVVTSLLLTLVSSCPWTPCQC